MTLILGIDPGTKGAFAVYDTTTRRLVGEVQDVPIWYQTVGKRKRPRIDALAVADMMDTYELMGVELIVLESVAGRGGQSAVAGFAFGYTVGVIYMACMYTGIAVDHVPPQTWKALMNVPGKGKADDSAIMIRADEMFPEDRNQFRGMRGGKRVDRAEAAMIAKYGGDMVLPGLKAQSDMDVRAAYRNVDTGA